MVNLTRIYTRTGDDGTTALGDMSRVGKNDLRLQAYADTDEANSSLGVALALGGLSDDVAALLTRIQNELFDVGADLCTPVVPDPEFPPLRVEASYIEALEAACDRYNDDLASALSATALSAFSDSCSSKKKRCFALSPSATDSSCLSFGTDSIEMPFCASTLSNALV